MSITKKTLIIIFSVLIIDQLLKILVKTNMTLGESSFNSWDWWNIKWFQIKFIENHGMAFGIDIPGKFGKPSLTIFRMIAVVGIGWYLSTLISKKAHTGLIICLSLIFAGAIGNIIDSALYGILFSESTYSSVSGFMAEEGGYSSLLYGKVVDMLYFPLIEGHFPKWFPVWKGQSFVFFRPIFNIADSSISIGVVTILIYQKRFFKDL